MPAFIAAAIGCALFLIGLRMAIEAGFPEVQLRRSVWIIWIPYLASALAMALFGVPRFKALRYVPEKTKDAHFFGMLMLGFLSISFTSCFAQWWYEETTAVFTRARSLEELRKQPGFDYAELGNIRADRKFTGVEAEYEIVYGSNSSEHRITCYFVSPLRDASETVSDPFTSQYWLAVEYAESIDPDLSLTERKAAADSFYERSKRDFERLSLDSVAYYKRVPYDSEIDHIQDAVRDAWPDAPVENIVFLSPEFEVYDVVPAYSLLGSAIGLLLGAVALSIFLQPLRYAPGEANPEFEKFRAQIELALINKRYAAGTLLIYGAASVLLASVFSGGSGYSANLDRLMEWGASTAGRTLEKGEYWRFFTSIFAITELSRFTYFAFFTVFGAAYLEPRFGALRFSLLFFATEIAGHVTHLYAAPDTIYSGGVMAVHGLWGASFALMLANKRMVEGGVAQGAPLVMTLFLGILFLVSLFSGDAVLPQLVALAAGGVLGRLFFATLPVAADETPNQA